MTVITVVRHVPAAIIGMVGVIHDRQFDAFEAELDWLEATGSLVERLDPRAQAGRLAAYPAAQGLLSAKGRHALPIVLVDGAVVWHGGVPSRAELAAAIGRARAGRPAA